MISDYATIPPIRTPLLDPTGDGSLTQKEWYQFWNALGQGINALGNAIQFGTIDAFPDPSSVPSGSLFVVTDPGAAIYQNLADGWHYVAGTIWGTMSPDQRPTGLNANDAGLQFRSTDMPARYLIWSGSAWVDAAPTRYGTHAARLALVIANTGDAMMYAETDRNEVLYQLQNGTWHYCAGTMWGTYTSTDQRPTDLGANDAGFQFRSTDLPAKYFIWSGTVWADATPSGGAVAYYARATGALNPTTTFQDVPGAALTLAQAGTYHIVAVFDISIRGGDENQMFLGQLVAGSAQTGFAVFQAPMTESRATVTQQWLIAVTAGQLIKLQANKTGGTGPSLVTPQSTLAAHWVSP